MGGAVAKRSYNPFIVSGHHGFTPDKRKTETRNLGANEKNKNSVSTGDKDGKWEVSASIKSPAKIVNGAMSSDTSTSVSTTNTFRFLSAQDKYRTTLEDCEDGSEFFDVLDKYGHYQSYENKAGKKIHRELSKLKWNGYPEDSFDWIWSSIGPLSNPSPLRRITSDSPSINVSSTIDKPPEAVLRTALLLFNSSQDIAYSDTTNVTGPLFFNAYFSEPIKLNSTQKRSFKLVVNANQDNSLFFPENPLIPPYGGALELHIANVSTFNSFFSLAFFRTNDSTLPSLINALEGYTVGDKLAQGTNSNDVKALGLLKKSFSQLQDWSGDPCLPSPYTWDWVTCNNDTDSPRITALNLNDLGLTGTLPDFSAMDALKTINLRNNSLTEDIPEFLGTFPELTVLNLADNSFLGTVPSSISNNVNLKFTATGNPNLSCTPTSIFNIDPASKIPPPSTNTNAEPKIPSPADKGKSSKTLAQPIIILLIMFSGLLL
ncbi:probable LRR receptor-like serine/threonine-protein kinase At1g51810 [Papaver somniferum]|uniref:probable LRR receptor-like serine/threonine-protein kinase At1g51810 n=1 Tax=Papaver somniferum TaxID=3469 RepID=UPI000E6F884A|nr:probable LRR receptor-like serine/threonine-protein kinase At1g51810 [Papaver somniferum]